MILKLSNGEVIGLPTTFIDVNGNETTVPVEERLELVNNILSKYPDEFNFMSKMIGTRCGIRQDNNKMVKLKLDILSTYLVRCEKYTKEIMSRYKEIARPLQEKSFSQFNPDMVDLKGWH
ncbi:hypothetical protein [Paenibacillus chitinolyticus]|uniref:hypothetical protein n=1 Tax=Paenibacillus chitinolyticus TaxID=79263 RepID=UPI003D07909A